MFRSRLSLRVGRSSQGDERRHGTKVIQASNTEFRTLPDYVLHHAQKILAIFAAMRDFSRMLREAGHCVHYMTIDDPANRQSLTANLDALLASYNAGAFEYQSPDEWRLTMVFFGRR